MTAEARGTPKAPWSLWVVGVLAVLWNAYGAYDYTMSHVQKDAYFQSMGMTEAQIAYYHSLPMWMTGVWAIGVWGGVLGAVLLLLRSRYATYAFAASLAGLVASLVHAYAIDAAAAKAAGAQSPVLSAVLLAAGLFFLWFAARMTRRGVLR